MTLTIGFMDTDNAYHRVLRHSRRLAALLTSDGKALDFPVMYEVELSRHTNLALSGTHKPKTPAVDLPQAAAISLLRQLVVAGGKSILFAGRGEPCLNTELPSLIALARDLGLEVGLVTNGLHMQKELITPLVRHASLVVFTLDAASSGTFAIGTGTEPENFDLVVENLVRVVRLKKRNRVPIHVVARFKVSLHNAFEMISFAKKMRELGCNEVQFIIPEIPKVDASSLIRESENLSSSSFHLSLHVRDPLIGYDGPCYCHLFNCFVAVDRKLYPCRRWVESEKHCWGSVGENLLPSILLARRRKKIFQKSALDDCSGCSMVSANVLIHRTISDNCRLRNFVHESWKD
jgi:radical SAM protein with 4Fe4S-binding SPASM domain